MKMETEVKQKNRWKERFGEENEALKVANKEISDYKVEVSDLRAKTKVSDRILQEVRDERDMFKRLRDQAQTKYTDMMGTNEKMERELCTKRQILHDFESVKHQEVTKLKDNIELQRMSIIHQSMHFEDLASDMMRLKDRFLDQIEATDNQKSINRDLQGKLQDQKEQI